MPHFWKVRNILFWEGRILQNSPQKLGEFSPHSFSHLSWFEVLHMLGVCDIITFWGATIWLTNYNFHAHVQYCTTIHNHGCSIDKYRNVKDAKCQNVGRLGISHLEKEGFWKTHCKSCKSFLHIPSPTWVDLKFSYAMRLRCHQSFIGSYPIDKL